MTSGIERGQGADLGAILHERGALGGDAARAVMTRICDAVGARHHAGAVHGALEPSRLILTEGPGGGPPFTVEVRPGGAPASPAWRAPEQEDPARPITTAADVWTLGLIAFAIFTGRSYGSSREEEGAGDPLPPASARAVALGAGDVFPPGFDAWFARCVARDPAARFRDAREAGVAFETVAMRPPREGSWSSRSRIRPSSDVPSPRRILVIDDDRMALLLIGHHLRRAAYEVLTAGTGEEGLALARSASPTLILLDFMLPDIDGPEVLRRLRADDATRDVPVILLTATELASHIAEGFRAGANDYLMKPVDVRLLATRIDAALSARDRALRATVIAVRHQKLVADLEEARAEQEVTLSMLPAAWNGWWAIGGVAPSGMVGGDLIALYAGEGDERTAVVVDVAGHGAGAALVGATVKTALGLLLRRHGLVDALAALNEELTASGASRHACLACVHVKGRAVTVVNAGLPPVCIARGGAPFLEVTSSGVPPGLLPDQSYTATTHLAAPGDRIAVVSDGLVEPFGLFDEALPVLRDLGVLERARWTGHEQPADVADLLRDGLARLEGPQPDDATFLLLQAE